MHLARFLPFTNSQCDIFSNTLGIPNEKQNENKQNCLCQLYLFVNLVLGNVILEFHWTVAMELN